LYLIGRARFGLRLYAALSPEQRQALWMGKNLSVVRMTPAQRELFHASLEERSRFEPIPINTDGWTDGSLSLQAVPRTINVQQHAASPDSRAEPTEQRPPTTAGLGSGTSGSPAEVAAQRQVTRFKLQFWCLDDQVDSIDLTVAGGDVK
jgi:hypothetical protein